MLFTNALFGSPGRVMEYLSMPVLLGWYQGISHFEKLEWLAKKCASWLERPGARRLRDSMARSTPALQCPCTLDRVLAAPGFASADALCTERYCQYGNYDAATACFESFTLRSLIGYLYIDGDTL